MIATLNQGNDLTLPAEVRQAADFSVSATIYAEVLDDGAVVQLGEIDPDQWWFWTPRWQAGEREIDEQADSGPRTIYYSLEEFFAALDEHAERARSSSGDTEMETTTKTDELIAHLEATTMTVKLGTGDCLTLPEKIQKAAGLSEGDTLYAEVLDEGEAGFRVRLRKIDPDQRWAWTPESQASLQEAEENYATGRFTRYYSTEEFLAELDKRA